MRQLRKAAVLVPSFIAVTMVAVAPTSSRAADIQWIADGPAPGVYMHWYEPSFYAGFAPRTTDPDALHIELGRGNQLRVTMVVADDDLMAYPDDLVARRRLLTRLVDEEVIVMTQNRHFAEFAARLDELQVAELASRRGSIPDDEYLSRARVLLTTLLPGRVFPIAIPLARVVADFRPHALAPVEGGDLRLAARVLPGRVYPRALTPDLEAVLAATLAAVAGDDEAAAMTAVGKLVEEASERRYRVDGGHVRGLEVTAVYPVGTVKDWVVHDGRRLPAFGRTGVWPLIPRRFGKGETGTVDYISPNPGYGFLPNLGYEHAGGIAYNSYHNTAVRAPLASTPFLPAEWRKPPASTEPKRPYQNLWIISRGPVSHGCTRVASGHLAELRHMLPASSQVMEQVRTYRNLPQCYDVFDIDGSGEPRVMGVRYYLAYLANEERAPTAAYAQNQREPFYQWLYGGDLTIDGDRLRLRNVPTCDFVGKKAVPATVLDTLDLYEAPLAPEPLQFYRLRKAPAESPEWYRFVRELGRIGAGYEPTAALLLGSKPTGEPESRPGAASQPAKLPSNPVGAPPR